MSARLKIILLDIDYILKSPKRWWNTEEYLNGKKIN